MSLSGQVLARIRDLPDFPQPGVVFKDVLPLLADPEVRDRVIEDLSERARADRVEAVLGIEARGFVLGAMLAHHLGLPFVPARKPGKLPGALHGVDYDLEYGSARLEVQADALPPGRRVLVVDDVLATGGTAAAAVALVRRCDAEVVAVEVLIEIEALAGRPVVEAVGVPVRALVTV